jgi:predicted dehydrogenase
MRIFQESSYITVDFLEKSVEEYDVSDEVPSHIDSRQVFPLEGEKKKYIIYQKPEIEEHNALREELSHFADSVLSGQTPEVDGVSATRALQVALSIQQIIDGK